MELYILRHLPTKSNINGVYVGQVDEPIVDNFGIKDNDLIFKSRLRVLCSPYLRCKQTLALLLSKALNKHGALLTLHVDIIEELKARDIGSLAGKLKEDIRSKNKEIYLGTSINPLLTPPGGESFDVFFNRVSSFYKMVKGLELGDNEQLFLCSHVHVLRLLICISRNLDIRNHWNYLSFNFGEIYKVEL